MQYGFPECRTSSSDGLESSGNLEKRNSFGFFTLSRGAFCPGSSRLKETGRAARMSQDYQHACERAELLGLPVPTEEEWRNSQTAEVQNHLTDDVNDEALQNLDYTDESATRASGGLDELNSILSVTQKKINRFKTVCGSLSGLLKVKVGSRPLTPNEKVGERSREGSRDGEEEGSSGQKESLPVEVEEDADADTATNGRNAEGNPTTPRKIDFNEKMGSQLDKLDTLLAKAETAQYSMQHQNKQMRKFLK